MYAKMSKTENNQTEKDRGDQVQNSAGGYVFTLNKWARLERFLILGSDKNTYYSTAQKLTKENTLSIQECLKENPEKTVDVITKTSEQGRAVKNEPAIFALALACADEKAKTFAFNSIPRVCRTGTHVFQFYRPLVCC